jgi:hypothetical protein
MAIPVEKSARIHEPFLVPSAFLMSSAGWIIAASEAASS